MRRMVPTLFGVIGLVAFGFAGTAAHAAGPPVQNITQHFDNQQETFNDVDPCTGQPAQITLTYNGVAHITIQPDGKGHFTETEVGTFSFDYLDANGNPDNDVDASGRFTEWDGGNGYFDQNGNPIGQTEVTFTLNGQGTYTDSGASFSFHNNGHAMTDKLGNPKVEFFKAHCG
jgi:hypothetical protein